MEIILPNSTVRLIKYKKNRTDAILSICFFVFRIMFHNHYSNLFRMHCKI